MIEVLNSYGISLTPVVRAIMTSFILLFHCLSVLLYIAKLLLLNQVYLGEVLSLPLHLGFQYVIMHILLIVSFALYSVLAVNQLLIK